MKACAALIVAAAIAAPSYGGERRSAERAVSSQEKQETVGSPSLGEKHLSRLAERLRTKRRAVGIGLAGLGGVTMAAGAAALSQREEDEWVEFWSRLSGTLALAAGGVFLAAGAFTLALPTKAEREEKRVRAILDSVEKEKAAGEALAGLARWGRRNRMISGGVFTALSVYGAATGGDNEIAVPIIFGAAALCYFLGKSSEEKTYAAYREDSRLKLAPELVLSFLPRGGVSIGFSLDF